MNRVIGVLAILAVAGIAEAVKLRWDAPVTGEPMGYTIYRATTVGVPCQANTNPTFELYGTAPVSATPTFVDNSPVIGANYYNVTAYNSEGESLPSNQVCFQRQSQKTSAPLNLRIEP